MSTKQEVIDAIDAALAVATNLDDQSTLIAQLTQDRDTAIGERDAALAKIAAARTAAQADKDADAANAAGQSVLDALA